MNQDVDQWPDPLKQGFAVIPASGDWWVALSGGFDSVLLLHLTRAWVAHLSRRPRLQAIHVNHQLQPDAAHWSQFCRALCDRLGVPLTERIVDVTPRGEGLEDAARRQRYGVFEACLSRGDVLLQAHHADDQAETVLYRLMRGSGVDGLAGIPATRPVGEGVLHRPLLSLSRETLKGLPAARDLQWCEDPSNEDLAQDRNYLRHEVLPQMLERWPGVIATLGRTARHCAESGELLRELAESDRAALAVDGGHGLDCDGLRELSRPRQLNLLRFWLIRQGVQPPGADRLREGISQLLEAQVDRQPELSWGGWSLRRYQGVIHLVAENHFEMPVCRWDGASDLPWGRYRLQTVAREGGGISSDVWPLEVKAREGGEYLPGADGRPGKPLKKWLQEKAVPPWERDRLPLLWKGRDLVAVGDRWIAPEYRATPDRTGLEIRLGVLGEDAGPGGG